MKLSDGVEAAIHCASALASLPENAVMSASDLAEAFGVSPSYLLKHLKTMVAKGLLTSVSGPLGGYRLAKSPSEITFLDIVLAVDGSEPAFRCKEIRRNGPCPLDSSAYPKPCGIKIAMLKAEQKYRGALAEITIAAVTEDHLATSDPRVLKRGETYLAERARYQPQ
ncbi:RrF2 family transcriptional regulator [Cognatishimia activa]|uniref:RrF2 family transcriptional regulator n=1 Tax=Cognatishimia activa TaxID=1715691 RepID=UPI0022316686|nr:Rrf2 family transcriptional regulator [Cognatishimia activa]UZD91031.1 Rrf2 family transcriptional regulator [Cognatishimia activa]